MFRQRKKKEDEILGDDDVAIAKGGVACPFPWRLHEMLEAAEEEGLEDVVSWQPHGRSFTVYKPKEFVEKIMARFFGQSKYASFQRQLNLYGFSRMAHGVDKGAYYHFAFVRGHRTLVRDMVRRKIKGTKVRRALLPRDEPDFYAPQWKNHFKSTPPPNPAAGSRAPSHHHKESRLAAANFKVGSLLLKKPLVKKIGDTPLVEILPAPARLPEPVAEVRPVSPSSMEGGYHRPNGVTTGDLLFFEDCPFHFLDDADLLLEAPLPAGLNKKASEHHHAHSLMAGGGHHEEADKLDVPLFAV